MKTRALFVKRHRIAGLMTARSSRMMKKGEERGKEREREEREKTTYIGNFERQKTFPRT